MMKNLTKEITESLLNAESKVLATSNDGDINAVPVSTVKVENGKIWLVDYFFNKTSQNILANNKVALTFWTDFVGYQIKATVVYHSEGEVFEEGVTWIAELHPNRIVKGLLELEVNEIFDISIDKKRL